MNNSIITSFKTLKREFFYFPLCVVGGFELSRLLHSGENFVNMETWIDLPTFESLYKVNPEGHIWSNYYKKILIGALKRGYKQYALRRDGKIYHINGNRLVAAAFLGLDLNNKKLFACHKNDVRHDNRVENIFIGTAKDNIRDCHRKGRAVNNKGENNGMSKYTIDQITEVKSLLSTHGNTQIEKMTGVHNKLISDIRRGKRWGWLI